jgi:hypothetical protein
MGEIYTTHVTVSGMTWRYVVGVQLSIDYNVSTSDLAIVGSNSSAVTIQYASYSYSHAVPGFKPLTSLDVKPVVNEAVRLEASTNDMCDTGPDFGVKTRCFLFQLHAVAPVASNGWVLLGEVGKFVPISNQRIASIKVSDSGGFGVGLKGAPRDQVTMGAVKMGSAPIYSMGAIGTDGTAVLSLK